MKSRKVQKWEIEKKLKKNKKNEIKRNIEIEYFEYIKYADTLINGRIEKTKKLINVSRMN